MIINDESLTNIQKLIKSYDFLKSKWINDRLQALMMYARRDNNMSTT